jgi:hypothetical protein
VSSRPTTGAINDLIAPLDGGQRIDLVARRTGFTRITLWAKDSLVGTRRIYERAGFACDRR